MILAGVVSNLGQLRAQELEKLQQTGAVTGTVNINFKTRTEVDDKGKPKPGAKDSYDVSLTVGRTTAFQGKVERQPLITSSLLGRVEQPGQLTYALNLVVMNPVDLTQRKTVGKWVGTVPINAEGVYDLTGGDSSPLRISVEGSGQSPAMAETFGGCLHGKGKKSEGIMAYVRKWRSKEVALKVSNVDPMRFENVELAAGPAQHYPRTVVNGNLDFDYETGNWLTNGLRFKYTLNGKEYEDVVTGSIKWVEDENRANNGKGHYEFNLRWNEQSSEAVSKEAASYQLASDEEAFFAVDQTVPSLTGSVTFEDTLTQLKGESIPSASKTTYQLDANQLTKQQVMNFLKLWLLGIGPTNDE